MGLSDRKKIYENIEKLRKRPNICYVTSIRPNLGASITADAILPIIDRINEIPKDEDSIDFIIISNGGDPITALRIMSILRERFKNVSVLLPYVAYSAATIFALGADEIVMHPYSNLGPVDPQITVVHNNENGKKENKQFSSEDIRNYIEFVKNNVGLKDQKCLSEMMNSLTKEIGPTSIGFTKRSQQLSLTLSEKMLAWHSKDKKKNKKIAQKLNSEYYDHGYALGRIEAKEIGLKVIEPEINLEKELWDLWTDFRKDMQSDNVFDLIKEIMMDENAKKSISSIPILNIPADLPKELKNQIYQNSINAIKNITYREGIKRSFMLATIETYNKAYSVYQDFNISFWRNPDMSLGVNGISTSTGWIKNKEDK